MTAKNDQDKPVTKRELEQVWGKYVTVERFERAMTNIQQSFNRVDEALQTLIRIVQRQEETTAEFQKTLNDHAIHISKHDRMIYDNLERIEVIEKKIS